MSSGSSTPAISTVVLCQNTSRQPDQVCASHIQQLTLHLLILTLMHIGYQKLKRKKMDVHASVLNFYFLRSSFAIWKTKRILTSFGEAVPGTSSCLVSLAWTENRGRVSLALMKGHNIRPPVLARASHFIHPILFV